MPKRQVKISFPMPWEEARALMLRNRIRVTQFAAQCDVSTKHVREAITTEITGPGTERVRTKLVELAAALEVA